MTEQSAAEATPEKKSLGGEMVLPVAALVFTIYYFITIIDTPWTAQVSAFFIGSFLIAFILIYFVRSWLMIKRGEADLTMGTLFEPVNYVSKRLKLLVLTIGYIVAVRYVGFTITTFLFLLFAMLLLSDGCKKRLILGISLFLSLGGYFLFIVAFKTRFPNGPFEDMMKGLF